MNAVEYVRAGLALIPIPRGMKGPRVTGWQQEANAIRSEEQAVSLDGCNIGLAHRWCGTAALDLDDYQQASDWLAARGIDLQDLMLAADAVHVMSGRPNRAKLLYRLPDGVSWLPTFKPEGVGLELRCASRDGAATVQDVLPPSIHPDTGKPYEWGGAGDWHALPTLPDALAKLWRSLATHRETEARPPIAQSHAIAEGGRNVHLTSLAGTMRRRGMEQAAIEAALLVENAHKYQLPLPDAEVRAIAASVARYAPEQTSSEYWSDPRPLPPELHPVEAFDLALLPDTLRPWVADVCERVQCPTDFVAVPVMVALGSLIGRKVRIRPKTLDSWTVVPNVWGCIIGRPGTMKSPALSEALYPLRRLEALAREEYESHHTDYEAQSELAKLRKDAATDKVRKALKSGKGDASADALRVDVPDEPILRRYTAHQSSMQALGELLRQNQNGLMVERDELAGLLSNLAQEEKAEERGFYLTGPMACRASPSTLSGEG